MSEYQYVAFRAIDGPVSPKNMEFMERQSSRAEITPWSFDNEYNFGDFRGNAEEMLRRGYDVHLHHANFGIRKLLIRLPHGLPDASAAKPYFSSTTLKYIKDKKGPGGIVYIDPYHESGDLGELYDFEDLLDDIAPIRSEILAGDLRPLYLAHLALAMDQNHLPEETKEPPVPAGLDRPTDAQQALMHFYSLSKSLISAAAKGSPPHLQRSDSKHQSQHRRWLQGKSAAVKDAWLAELMSDASTDVRREIVAEFRKSQKLPAWPTARLDRTLAELETAALEIAQEAKRKSADKAARDKVKRLAKIAADPAATLRETEELVQQRTGQAYDKIGKLLSELRDALAGTAQSGLAAEQAKKLKAKHPTLRILAATLRKAGLLPK